jgi:hypothetical protein
MIAICPARHSTSAIQCRTQQERFLRSYQLALVGDHIGQRNVAACLSDGCHGAVKVSIFNACVWRLVVLMSGHREIDISDSDLAEAVCSTLTTGDRFSAVALSNSVLDGIQAVRR